MDYEAVYPELTVLAWPLGATTRTAGRGWAVADVIAHGIRLMAAGHETRGGTLFENITNLTYETVRDEIDGTELGGFAVAPTWHPTNGFVTYGNPTNEPDDTAIPSPRYGCVQWRVPERNWATCRRDDQEVTGITHHAQSHDTPFVARTARPVPRAQDFALDLRTWAPRASMGALAPPWVSLSWGNGLWQVIVRPRSAPVLCRADGGKAAVVREFPQDAAQGWFQGERCTVYVRYIAGRMRVDLETPAGFFSTAYTERTPAVNELGGTIMGVHTLEPEDGGPLVLAGMGTGLVATLAEGRHRAWDAEAGVFQRVGSFMRQYWAPVSPLYSEGGMSGVQAVARGYPALHCGADNPQEFPVEVARITDMLVKGNRRAYKVELYGSHRYVSADPVQTEEADTAAEPTATAKSGWTQYPGWARADVADRQPLATQRKGWTGLYHNNWWRSNTPFLHAVSLHYRSRFKRLDDTPLDISPAVLTANCTHTDPGISPGKSFGCTVDHDILPECVRLGETHAVEHDWTQYVGKHRQITVAAAWRNADDEPWFYWPAVGYVPGGAAGMFSGYISEWNPSATGTGAGTGTISARDHLMRLEQPAGLIDERYAPLDLLWYQKHRTLKRAVDLHGWEAVHYIVEQTLGPTYLRYYPYPAGWAGKHGLLSYALFFAPPEGVAFLYPPPWGSDALSWIRQICERDFAVFFWDRRYADGKWLWMPHYGNYWAFVHNAQEYPLRDHVEVEAVPWDAATALQQIAPHERGQADINRILVWGQPPRMASTQTDLWPTVPIYRGEGRIEESADESQGIAATWERTKVLKGPHFGWPGVPQAVATLILSFVHNCRLRSTTFKTRGQPGMSWGNLPRMDTGGPQSDLVTELHGERLRVARVQHRWDFGENVGYTTTADCMPVPASTNLAFGSLDMQELPPGPWSA